jgi:ferric-dicitrate binding protein FerR (iron transport regulator)
MQPIATAHKIVIADGAIGQQHFSGSFKATDTEGLAKQIAAAFHLTMGHDRAGDYTLSASR